MKIGDEVRVVKNCEYYARIGTIVKDPISKRDRKRYGVYTKPYHVDFTGNNILTYDFDENELELVRKKL